MHRDLADADYLADFEEVREHGSVTRQHRTAERERICIYWGDQVAVGGVGGGEFVVAFLDILASVEELLFEFGDSLTEGADFIGSGEASVVDDLLLEDFGQPLAELGVLVSESFVAWVLPIVHIIPSDAVVHPHRIGPDAEVHNTWTLPREQSTPWRSTLRRDTSSKRMLDTSRLPSRELRVVDYSCRTSSQRPQSVQPCFNIKPPKPPRSHANSSRSQES